MARKSERPYQFTVRGRGRFPIDMLRYDQCWPHYGVDASAIAASLEHPDADEQCVVLESSSASLPTQARWASFGWSVLGVGVIRTASGTFEQLGVKP